MPELPEVETIANGVDARVRGETIVSSWFSSYKEPFKTAPDEIAAAMEGRRIERVRRVGKHIVVDLAAAAPSARRDVAVQLLIHLGMTGRLLVSAAEVPLPAHTHAILRLGSGKELRCVDARRFGRIGIHTAEGGGFAGPGREPLTIPAADFAALFRGR